MKIFSRFPVFRVALPFTAGIIGTLVFNILPTISIALSSGAFVLSYLFTIKKFATGKYAQRWLAGIPFYCCFFGLGGMLGWFHQGINHTAHFSSLGTSNKYFAEISDEPSVTKNGFRLIVKVNAVLNGTKWIAVRGSVLIFLKDTLHQFPVKAGNKILFSGLVKNISGPRNPDAFDARNFYAGKGAWHQLNANFTDIQILNVPATKTSFTYARMLRDEMLVKLKRHLGGDDLGVAGALLLGYEDWLDPELENYWSGAGVLHVLCVSGMHVMLIYVILAGLLGWMGKNKVLRHLRYLMLLLLIWFYAMVTGFSPSVIRAAAMISFVIAGNWINREASIYNLLCSSCILMFILDPYLVLSAGFQLSFLAVCGIIFLHKLIFQLWTAPNIILHKIWELISISLAAQLSTFPLSLFLFHQFPNYFLLANLLIIPLSTLVMYSGLLLLVTDWLPFAGMITGTVTSYGIKFLNWLVITIGSIPGALTKNIYLSFFEMIMMYLLLIFIPVWLLLKSRSWLFISLIIGFLILSERIYLLWEANNNNNFSVYQSSGKTILSFVSGRNATIIADTNIDERSLKFAAEEHLVKQLISQRTVHYLEIGSLIVLNISTHKKIFVIKDLKKEHRLKELNTTDAVIVLGGKITIKGEELVKNFSPSLVIFDSSCKGYQLYKLKKDLADAGVTVYDVSKQGAFQQSFN